MKINFDPDHTVPDGRRGYIATIENHPLEYAVVERERNQYTAMARFRSGSRTLANHKSPTGAVKAAIEQYFLLGGQVNTGEKEQNAQSARDHAQTLLWGLNQPPEEET